MNIHMYKYERKETQMAIHGGDIYRNSVKLDFSVNTNPFGMPRSVNEALHRAVELCTSYPDMEAQALKEAVGRMLSLPEQYLLFGNGASELFMAITHAIKPKKTLIPVPAFYGYEYVAAAVGSEILYYGLKRENDFCVKKDLCERLTEDVELLFLANPNNPTGRLPERETAVALLQCCLEKGIYVVADECFIEFCEGCPSLLSELNKNDRLLIVRTFTKIFSIPGVRLGYLLCKNRVLLTKIAGQLPEWNLSCFAQEAGCACAGEKAFWAETENYVRRERAFLEEALKQCGFQVFPSEANFILLYRNEKLGKATLYEQLLQQGILIRDCGNFRGLGSGFYRIAVKTREENRKLLQALAQAEKP